MTNNVSVYPNPTTQELYFNNISPELQFSVYDMKGNLVIEKIRVPIKLDVSNFPQGQYIIKVGNQSVRFKKD